jgi:uncharacterized RDD family membrane protein YckC
MTANIDTAKLPSMTVSHRTESHVRVRYRAPFALRCGALLIDYIVLVLIMTFSTMIARLMGGGARMAGGTAEKIGIILMLVVAVLDLGVLAGLTGKSIGKWITGLRIERIHGGLPGIPRCFLRHFVGYPLSIIPFGIGFLMVIVSPSGRALHDLISGTVVVRRNVALVPAAARQPRSPKSNG